MFLARRRMRFGFPDASRLGVVGDSGGPVEATCETHRYLTTNEVVSDPAEPHET